MTNGPLANSLKEHYTVHDKITCGVTETGGTVAALQHTGKLTNSVLSAGLNTGVIRKDATQIQALVHAALEASSRCFLAFSC